MRRKQRLSWGSQDKDGPDVELGEKVTPGEGNGVGQPRRQREQIMSRDTAQHNWLEPRDVEGSKGNQAVWEGYGHTIKT